MDNKQHLLIAANYRLYAQKDGRRETIEQTAPERPYVFITGFQMALDGFEDRVSVLAAGDKFSFSLPPAEAFGDYDPEGVHILPREAFNVKGHFDRENVFEGAVIAVQNPQGQEFHAQVTKVDATNVTIDTNHPLAGRVLTFEGDIVENRPATQGEIDQLIKQLMSTDDNEDNGGCGHCCHHEDGATSHHCCHHEDGGAEHHCCHHEGEAGHCCHHEGNGHHCCHHHDGDGHL